jgi:hypothetical protein
MARCGNVGDRAYFLVRDFTRWKLKQVRHSHTHIWFPRNLPPVAASRENVSTILVRVGDNYTRHFLACHAQFDAFGMLRQDFSVTLFAAVSRPVMVAGLVPRFAAAGWRDRIGGIDGARTARLSDGEMAVTALLGASTVGCGDRADFGTAQATRSGAGSDPTPL